MEFHQDWKEFIRLLNKHEVRFLVVGAFAVAHHGWPRLTGDIDFWVAPDSDSAEQVAQVIETFGFAVRVPGDASPFAISPRMIHLGRQPFQIDVMNSIDGVAFEDAWIEREEGELGGETVAFLSRRHLVANKKSTNRIKDDLDVAQLELIWEEGNDGGDDVPK